MMIRCVVGELIESPPQPVKPVNSGMPSVIIYGDLPAGIGFSENAITVIRNLMVGTRVLIADYFCGERDGLPSCIWSHHCGNENADKKRTVIAIDVPVTGLEAREHTRLMSEAGLHLGCDFGLADAPLSSL